MALIQVNFVSRMLMRTVPIQVILPVDKFSRKQDRKQEDKPFKTLYLLHGIFGNYTDWVTNTRIQKWAEARNLAVVMPSGENAFYVDDPVSGNLYGEFIGKELVEITRRMFPLSHKREDTFIAGLSMGGFGAVRNGLKYHETFGYIATLSGALHLLEKDVVEEVVKEHRCFGDPKQAVKSDNNPRVLLEKIQKLQKTDPAVTFPKIYQTCGTEDFLYQANCLYRDLFRSYGVELTWDARPGKHDWDYWDETIQNVLAWLPLDEENQGMTSGSIDA